jgi:hypothetical protein
MFLLPRVKSTLRGLSVSVRFVCFTHRLSINRPTKRGKEKSASDGHSQCEKEMNDHLLACQQIFEIEPHGDQPAKERASFLKINDISFFGSPNCHHFCSVV